LEEKVMQRVSMILVLGLLVSLSSGCLATRKFVRNDVKDASDTLGARLDKRIDKTDGDVAEVRDGVARVDGKVNTVDGKVTAVDGRVTQLDTRTNERFATVKDDISGVDKKTATVQSNVSALDGKFESRNQYTVASQASILFKFDSAKLDGKYDSDLEQVVSALQKNANAIVVLEGRTDSKGASEYNLKLGERRVDAVRRHLAVDMGIPVFRIHDVSFGADKPLAENTSKEGREKNRAVIITILVPKSSTGDSTSITPRP
jgi:outer membrane protein OmpA-like peptidoglycan-associated protein